MLKLVLFLNMVSCLVFGMIFLAYTEAAKLYLGIADAAWLLPTLGTILIIFALHLASAIIRKKNIKGEVYYFSIGDMVWVTFTGIILGFTEIIQSTEGFYSAVLVALMVGVFGLAQFYLAQKLPNDSIVVRSKTDRSQDEAWWLLQDFGGIGQYHPIVKTSELLTSQVKGVGTKRSCEFYDGSTIEEVVTDWQEGSGYTVAISGMKMPIRVLKNQLLLSDGDIVLKVEFACKGVFSEVLIGFLMRPLLIGRQKKVAKGFAEAVSSARVALEGA
jgi:energy-converting hydrogenase Eha subunit C